jgi:uncharacterized protein (DUF302 family)
MELTLRTAVESPYAETVARVREALKEQGFGVLTEIDVRKTLKDKIDVDVEPQVILGACNPRLAHRALEADPRIASLLPCNVVVRTEGGRTIIEAVNPQLLAEVSRSPALGAIAEEAGRRLQAALEATATG